MDKTETAPHHSEGESNMSKSETITVETDVTLYFDHGGKVFRIEQCGNAYKINDPLNVGNVEFAKLKIDRISGRKFPWLTHK